MLIKLKDYIRIHAVITAVLDNEDARTDKACLYYALIGAMLIEKHFGIKAQLSSGVAAYHLGDNENILVFGNLDADKETISASSTGFHAWVDAGDWMIDFMAPNFADMTAIGDRKISYPAKMMQKRYDRMAESPLELKKPGDFYVQENIDLTLDHIRYVQHYPMIRDLVEICNQWFRKAPEKMVPTAHIGNQKGEMSSVNLAPRALKGVW